jgi:uncharacterized protein YndB with AHSA1/START domain/DNA-binding HxlR family transcriptional regulator
MFGGMTRFTEFQRALGIAPNTLTSRLEWFVEAGLMQTRPPGGDHEAHECVLTAKGFDLQPVIIALTVWGDRWAVPQGPPIIYEHKGCGGRIHQHLDCEDCGDAPAPTEVVARPGPGSTNEEPPTSPRLARSRRKQFVCSSPAPPLTDDGSSKSQKDDSPEKGRHDTGTRTTMTATMSAQDIAEVMSRPYSRELLASRIPARLAYTGLDGDPRVVPVGYEWDGTHVTLASAVGSAKTEALRGNPKVALTIESEDFPPRVLLLRGTARIEVVDGVPDVFFRASKRRMSDDQWPGWAAGVRALYDQMALITITPMWAKLLVAAATRPSSLRYKKVQLLGCVAHTRCATIALHSWPGGGGMPMTDDRIEREILIAAAPERVWPLVAEPGFWATDDESIRDRVATEGQSLVVRHSQHGDFPIRVEKVDPPKYLAYRWVSAFPGKDLRQDNSTLVEFTLTPEGNATRLRVVESGFAALPTSEENRRNVINDHTAGWEQCLAALTARAE